MTSGNEPIQPLRGHNGDLLCQSSDADMNYLEDLRPFIGLTKREYLSAMAMQGMLANPEALKIMSSRLSPDEAADYLSVAAIEQADSLIEQLNKPI